MHSLNAVPVVHLNLTGSSQPFATNLEKRVKEPICPLAVDESPDGGFDENTDCAVATLLALSSPTPTSSSNKRNFQNILSRPDSSIPENVPAEEGDDQKDAGTPEMKTR
jgi:hypothetical protein